MADTPDADEKTEAPTEKRKRDAAEQGDILRSRDLSMAAVMMAGAVYLVLAGPLLVEALMDTLRQGLTISPRAVTDFRPGEATATLIGLVALPLIGFFIVAILGALAGQLLLGTFQFNPKLFAPKFSRINPLAGLKRMFGMQGLIELGKSILKILLIAAVGSWILWDSANRIAALGQQDMAAAGAHAGELALLLLLVLAGGLFLIAGVDVPLQIFQLLKKLRMTRQEIKDELKQTEGSPEAKMAIRRRAREALRNNNKAAVATAHVVLTNPTHFAVALRYDRLKDRAPVVVAKGKGEVALVIRELAREAGKPVLEYPMLARAVYFTSKVGQEIRDDLYVAVASVLAFVFSLDRDLGQVPPQIEVPEEARFDENGRKMGG